VHYVATGRAIVRESRLYLPNGQYIPNDGSNRGLKHSIDTWLLTNSTLAPDTLPPVANPTAPVTFRTVQRDAPPHQALSFEAIHSEVHMAEITDATDDEAQDELIEDEDLGIELFELYEVLATEKRKGNNAHHSRPKNAPAPAVAPAAASTAPVPANAMPSHPAFNAANSTAWPAHQYQYQLNAEDHKLTSELSEWLLDGQLARTMPAHVLVASPHIRKEMAHATSRSGSVCNTIAPSYAHSFGPSH
jgi:hypothetical protein